MLIVLIRHGRTACNLERRIQGHRDIGLSTKLDDLGWSSDAVRVEEELPPEVRAELEALGYIETE